MTPNPRDTSPLIYDFSYILYSHSELGLFINWIITIRKYLYDNNNNNNNNRIFMQDDPSVQQHCYQRGPANY